MAAPSLGRCGCGSRAGHQGAAPPRGRDAGRGARPAPAGAPRVRGRRRDPVATGRRAHARITDLRVDGGHTGTPRHARPGAPFARRAPDDRAHTGEIRNAWSRILLEEGDAAGALEALKDVLSGTAPVFHALTLVEAHLLAGLAHRELGESRAAGAAVEAALAVAEPDRLILPFAMTGSLELLESLPQHKTAHRALWIDILDVLRGLSPAATGEGPPMPLEELSRSELRVLRYLPTNLTRMEISRELHVTVNTVNTHVRNIYSKLSARDRSAAVRYARELRLLSSVGSR
jgi:LuxR family transcriptional regulator, maltose regulon positive regulatory protein